MRRAAGTTKPMQQENKATKTNMKKRLFLLLNLALGLTHAALAQNTAFTYQGKLTDSGNPANGLYDMVFGLYDAPTNGNFLNSFGAAGVPVNNGLFTVNLDFGSAPFTGPRRWLQAWSRTNNVGNYDPL